MQAEKASLVHFLDFLSLIFLALIWAISPRDSLAVIGEWIQSRLKEVRLTLHIILPCKNIFKLGKIIPLNSTFGEKRQEEKYYK